MKPQIILLALALAEMVPAGVRAQTAAPVAPVLAGRVGRASSLDFLFTAIPKSRAGTLDLRAHDDPQGRPPDNPNAIFSTQLSKSGDLTAGPAYYNDGRESYLFYCGEGGKLSAFSVISNKLALIGSSAEIFWVGGTTPTLSSNQATSGTVIVWCVSRDDGANTSGQFGHTILLRAYDFSKLAISNPSAGLHPNPGKPNAGWPLGSWNGRAFVEPTIINGRVYVASENYVRCYTV